MDFVKTIIGQISPKLLTRILFYKNFNKFLNLNNPKDINEKLQYLKFNNYYKNDIITQCVDKYRVREVFEEEGTRVFMS